MRHNRRMPKGERERSLRPDTWEDWEKWEESLPSKGGREGRKKRREGSRRGGRERERERDGGSEGQKKSIHVHVCLPPVVQSSVWVSPPSKAARRMSWTRRERCGKGWAGLSWDSSQVMKR